MQLFENPDNWYFDANVLLRDIAAMYSEDFIKVCGYFAALSPRCPFQRNIDLLCQYLETGSASCLGLGVRKCHQIRGLKNPAVKDIEAILNGPKITAFFLNCYDPSIDGIVTIDTWILIWAGYERSTKLTSRRNRSISAKICDMAKSEGLLAHQMQARIWCQIRGANI